MINRSLVASIVLAGCLAATGASAQVLLCPEAPPSDIPASETSAETERLLTRLTAALDLHGHSGVEQQDIMHAYADTPNALLAKITGVAERCHAAAGDVETFFDALPDLRRAFLEAAMLPGEPDTIETASAEEDVSNTAEEFEEAIDLSVRELWRKLWFRPAKDGDPGDERWAVIVASPGDADSGWDQLGRHQRRWVDTYFQLHEPYFDDNPHHAIVVGRRLPEDQAVRLRDYVIELGMAEDSYIWALPHDDVSPRERGSVASETGDFAGEDKIVHRVETVDESFSQPGELDLSLSGLQ